MPGLLLSWIFPDDCRLCGTHLAEWTRIPVCPKCLTEPERFIPEYFCANCQTPFLNSSPLDQNGCCAMCRLGLTTFDAAHAFTEYEGPVRKLVHLFKYGKVDSLDRVFGAWMSSALPRDSRPDLIVFMPLHWLRQWKRGFNQSELLARSVGKRTGIPVRNLLRRKKSTPPQAGLTNAERRKNVQGAFSVPRPDAVTGKHVLLIDDVLTTGATAGACAAVLKRAGARRVSVLTLARVDRRRFLGSALN